MAMAVSIIETVPEVDEVLPDVVEVVQNISPIAKGIFEFICFEVIIRTVLFICFEST